jgi:hypothetical protein
MDSYFHSQLQEANVLAFRYFLKIIAKPEDKKFMELTFMTKLFGFHHHLSENHQDRDVATELTGDLLEALFQALWGTAVITLFRPGDLNTCPGSTPSLTMDQLYTSGKRIMELSKIKDPRRRINKLGDLLDEVSKFVESVFVWSSINNFRILSELYGEMKYFWKCLKAQRTEAIRLKPSLKTQLEAISIFPLLYKPTECANNLVPLLNKYKITFKEDHIYNIPNIRKKIEGLANFLVIYEDKNFAQTEEIIASNTGCQPEDLSIKNYFTFNLAVLNSVKPPSYKECWLRTNYNNPSICNLIFDLDIEYHTNIYKMCDKYEAHRLAKNQVTEEDDNIEVISPDFTTSTTSLQPVTTKAESKPEDPLDLTISGRH